MTRTISLVQRVQIASPCPAKWDDMIGDDRSRFCAHCKLNVYNLSAMTEADGEALIREKEGRICARIYRRYDGTILTQDCPVGWRAVRRRAMWLTMRAAAALFFVLSSAVYAIEGSRPRNQQEAFERLVRQLQSTNIDEPFDSNSPALVRLRGWLTAEPTRVNWIGGDVAFVPPPTAPAVQAASNSGGR